MSQALAMAALQLKVLVRKRVLVTLVAVWLVQLVVLLQVGERGRVVGLQMTILVADLLVVVMACGLIADEAALGTFPFLLAHGIERRTFLVGKLSPVVGIAFAFSACAQIGMLVAGRTGGLTIGTGAAILVQASSLSLVRILVLAAVTTFMSVTLTNRYLAAIGALLYCYGLTSLMHRALPADSLWLSVAESFLPWRHNLDLVAAASLSGHIALDKMVTAVVQPLLYTVFFGMLAVRAVERRDLAHFGE